MAKTPVSVVTIAKNEESNIENCLRSTEDWAEEHVIVDDFSTDRTVELAKKYTNKIYSRRMDIEGIHRNWAYSKAGNEWVLSLDADEVISATLKSEISEVLKKSPEHDAYSIPIKTYVGNHWVKYCGWYPASKLRLFRKSRFRYEEVGVHPRAILDGTCGFLKSDIIHKGYPDFAHLIGGLNAQTTLEAQKWFDEKRKINSIIMLRKACDRFLRSYLRKKGYRDGMVGFVISLNSALYQVFSYVKYWELRNEGNG